MYSGYDAGGIILRWSSSGKCSETSHQNVCSQCLCESGPVGSFRDYSGRPCLMVLVRKASFSYGLGMFTAHVRDNEYMVTMLLEHVGVDRLWSAQWCRK